MSDDIHQASTDEIRIRREKADTMRQGGLQPYADRYERTHTPAEALLLADATPGVKVCGRVVGIRSFGKLTFCHLYDMSGKIQIALQKNKLGESFQQFTKTVDVGDFIGAEGAMMTTRTGEKTLDVDSWTFLTKTIRPLPEKFHGMTDPELRLRRRYLDLIATEEVRDRFKMRTKVIRTIRSFLDDNGFTEIDTPVLTNKASGALARPFVTHNNALDIDVFLRISPETYLKRAIAGGFDKVYEFARSFRNEGVDATHLPDFTLLEYYCAYWNYVDNMNFTEKLMKHLLMTVKGSEAITWEGKEIDFSGDWPRNSFREVIQRDCGIDIDAFATKEALWDEIRKLNVTLDTDVDIKKAGRGTLIDLLYKKVSRPLMIKPQFITHQPLDLCPLVRRNDANTLVGDRFQLVVNGQEMINAYSELVDPVDQAERFEQQAEARRKGDTETMDVDHDFLLCMEYGMPPISGWGMGIDRIVGMLSDAKTLRDVVLFPLLRPE